MFFIVFNMSASNFERFWSAYPRKVGKGAAIKAFAKAEKESDDSADLTHRIIISLDVQKRARKKKYERKEFVAEWPHPATWINQLRWLDEVETDVKGGPFNTYAREVQVCENKKCPAKKAAVYPAGGKFVCVDCATKYYRNRDADGRRKMLIALERIDMRKLKSETLPDYYRKCREYCVNKFYK
jgi:hypothetical protein